MGQVSITLNGRTYRLRCGDGEEARLLELSAHLRDKIERLTADFGQVGDDRLVIMAALLTTDELFEARGRLAEMQTADPSLYAPLDDEPPSSKPAPAAVVRSPSPPAEASKLSSEAAPDSPPAAAKIKTPPPQPGVATQDAPGSSLKRAMQRPQGKATLSERLAEVRDTIPATDRPAHTSRKAGNA